jgi:hypothetical protein
MWAATATECIAYFVSLVICGAKVEIYIFVNDLAEPISSHILSLKLHNFSLFNYKYKEYGHLGCRAVYLHLQGEW